VKKDIDWVETMKQINCEASRHLLLAKLSQTPELQADHLQAAERLEQAASIIEAVAE
jgi:hypothetical protein